MYKSNLVTYTSLQECELYTDFKNNPGDVIDILFCDWQSYKKYITAIYKLNLAIYLVFCEKN